MAPGAPTPQHRQSAHRSMGERRALPRRACPLLEAYPEIGAAVERAGWPPRLSRLRSSVSRECPSTGWRVTRRCSRRGGGCTARHQLNMKPTRRSDLPNVPWITADNRGWSLRCLEVPDRLNTAAVRWLGPREVSLGMQALGHDGGPWTSRSGGFSAEVAAVLRRGLGQAGDDRR